MELWIMANCTLQQTSAPSPCGFTEDSGVKVSGITMIVFGGFLAVEAGQAIQLDKGTVICGLILINYGVFLCSSSCQRM